MDSPADLIEIGYVARAHGVRGELRVVCHNPDSTTLLDAEAVFLAGRRRAVIAARPTAGAVLLTVDGVADRDAAEALRGQAVAVERGAIALADGEVLVADLIGCEAVLGDGSPYGTIVAIEPGPQTRLVIHHGAVERLVPLVPELVVAIERAARRVVLEVPADWPESPR